MTLKVFEDELIAHTFGLFLCICSCMYMYFWQASMRMRDINKLLRFYLIIPPFVSILCDVTDYAYYLIPYRVFKYVHHYLASSSPNPLFDITYNVAFSQQFRQFPFWMVLLSYVYNIFNGISFLVGIILCVYWVYKDNQSSQNPLFILMMILGIATLICIICSETGNHDDIEWYYHRAAIDIMHHLIFMTVFYLITLRYEKRKENEDRLTQCDTMVALHNVMRNTTVPSPTLC